MKALVERSILVAVCVGALAGSSGAAVTLTQTTVPVSGTSTCGGVSTPWTFDVPVYVLENDLLQVVVFSGTRGNDGDCGYADHVGRLAAIIKKTGAGAGANQVNRPVDYPAFLDRVNAKSGAGYAVTPHVDDTDADPGNDDSDAKQSLAFDGVVNAGTADAPLNFPVRKVYRLRDGSRTLEVSMQFRNESGAMYNAANPQNGLQTLVYATPGGATPAADEVMVKTLDGLDVVVSGTAWWGLASSGTPKSELAEGWMAAVDTATGVADILAWDLPTQKTYSYDGAGVSANKAFFGSNRIQMEVLFNHLDDGQTLNYTEYFIVSEGVPVVSYAAPDSVVAGVSLTAPSYPQGATVKPTFSLSSTKAAGTPEAAYDVKNIRVEKADGTQMATMADSLGVTAAANAVASFTRQFTLSAAFEPGNYVIKADLFPAGGATKISTLISKPFAVTSADVKVQLYQDTVSGAWVLENELYRLVFDLDNKGEIVQFVLKEADNRNQANSTYDLFRDYVRTTGSLTGFSGYAAIPDPFGTDTPTRKTIQFGPGFNAYADVTKIYTLESNGRSVKVDFTFVNYDSTTLTAQGFFSHVAVSPGGGGNTADRFSARTVSGLATPHTASQRLWFGAEGTTGAGGTVVPASQPELAEPWMAVTDTTLSDAIALTWDMTKQKQYSGVPTGLTEKVTMNSVYQAGGFGRHVLEPHFTDIPGNETLTTTMYLMADDGFGLVSYAEPNRVMGGIWTEGDTVDQGGALKFFTAITNTGTTQRTFDLSGIRIRKDTGETTSAQEDQTGIVLAAAAQDKRALTFTVPAEQPAGNYVVEADVMEAGAKVGTLTSLPFTVNVAQPARNGDVNGDNAVDNADILLALQIAAGLTAADGGNVRRGDLAGADNLLLVEDAVAIIRKVNGL